MLLRWSASVRGFVAARRWLLWWVRCALVWGVWSYSGWVLDGIAAFFGVSLAGALWEEWLWRLCRFLFGVFCMSALVFSWVLNGHFRFLKALMSLVLAWPLYFVVFWLPLWLWGGVNVASLAQWQAWAVLWEGQASFPWWVFFAGLGWLLGLLLWTAYFAFQANSFWGWVWGAWCWLWRAFWALFPALVLLLSAFLVGSAAGWWRPEPRLLWEALFAGWVGRVADQALFFLRLEFGEGVLVFLSGMLALAFLVFSAWVFWVLFRAVSFFFLRVVPGWAFRMSGRVFDWLSGLSGRVLARMAERERLRQAELTRQRMESRHVAEVEGRELVVERERVLREQQEQKALLAPWDPRPGVDTVPEAEAEAAPEADPQADAEPGGEGEPGPEAEAEKGPGRLGRLWSGLRARMERPASAEPPVPAPVEKPRPDPRPVPVLRPLEEVPAAPVEKPRPVVQERGSGVLHFGDADDPADDEFYRGEPEDFEGEGFFGAEWDEGPGVEAADSQEEPDLEERVLEGLRGFERRFALLAEGESGEEGEGDWGVFEREFLAFLAEEAGAVAYRRYAAEFPGLDSLREMVEGVRAGRGPLLSLWREAGDRARSAWSGQAAPEHPPGSEFAALGSGAPVDDGSEEGEAEPEEEAAEAAEETPEETPVEETVAGETPVEEASDPAPGVAESSPGGLLEVEEESSGVPEAVDLPEGEGYFGGESDPEDSWEAFEGEGSAPVAPAAPVEAAEAGESAPELDLSTPGAWFQLAVSASEQLAGRVSAERIEQLRAGLALQEEVWTSRRAAVLRAEEPGEEEAERIRRLDLRGALAARRICEAFSPEELRDVLGEEAFGVLQAGAESAPEDDSGLSEPSGEVPVESSPEIAVEPDAPWPDFLSSLLAGEEGVEVLPVSEFPAGCLLPGVLEPGSAGVRLLVLEGRPVVVLCAEGLQAGDWGAVLPLLSEFCRSLGGRVADFRPSLAILSGGVFGSSVVFSGSGGCVLLLDLNSDGVELMDEIRTALAAV